MGTPEADGEEQPESMNQFQVQIDDDTILGKGDIVEHIEHGPMYVDRVSVGPTYKEVSLRSELDSTGVHLTDDEIREIWGEKIHFDPVKLRDPGTARFESEGITVDDTDIEVTVSVEGAPQKDAELVYAHAVEETVRALQATRDEVAPDECKGGGCDIKWDQVSTTVVPMTEGSSESVERECIAFVEVDEDDGIKEVGMHISDGATRAPVHGVGREPGRYELIRVDDE